MTGQTTTQAAATVFDAILASLKGAAAYNRDDVARPAAILWPDEKREWETLLPPLRLVLPQFLIFGPYDKTTRSGPAIWLRCVLAGRIPDVTWAPEEVPIIYLPGVSRPTLRATEECPAELRPLAELQYRGVFWSQSTGKDWTIPAFLQSERGGLGRTSPGTKPRQRRFAAAWRSWLMSRSPTCGRNHCTAHWIATISTRSSATIPSMTCLPGLPIPQ